MQAPRLDPEKSDLSAVGIFARFLGHSLRTRMNQPVHVFEFSFKTLNPLLKPFTWYDHCACMYHYHSTCIYCDDSTYMYYVYSTCMWYDHSTCMFYDHSTCMYHDHSTSLIVSFRAHVRRISAMIIVHAYTTIIVHACSIFIVLS